MKKDIDAVEEKTPDWGTRTEWGPDEAVFCPRCGSAMVLFNDAGSYDSESWLCTDKDCKTVVELNCEYQMIKRPTGGAGALNTMVSKTLRMVY
jgi:hypothetical protein